MKDFTTAIYIDPIIEYCKKTYIPVKDKATLQLLNCDVLLKKVKSNDYKALRKNDYFFIYSEAVKKLYELINDFSEYASTYEGELDQWNTNEKDRVQEAIKNRLIELYA